MARGGAVVTGSVRHGALDRASSFLSKSLVCLHPDVLQAEGLGARGSCRLPYSLPEPVCDLQESACLFCLLSHI